MRARLWLAGLLAVGLCVACEPPVAPAAIWPLSLFPSSKPPVKRTKPKPGKPKPAPVPAWAR